MVLHTGDDGALPCRSLLAVPNYPLRCSKSHGQHSGSALIDTAQQPAREQPLALTTKRVVNTQIQANEDAPEVRVRPRLAPQPLQSERHITDRQTYKERRWAVFAEWSNLAA
jgi:hypothetical protein